MGGFGNLMSPGALEDFRNRFSKMAGGICPLCLLPTTDFENQGRSFHLYFNCVKVGLNAIFFKIVFDAVPSTILQTHFGMLFGKHN